MTSRRSPGVAAFLSFLWPGLGQLFSGRRVWALLFALPAVALVVPVVYEAVNQGPIVFAARFAVASLCLVAVALIVVFGLLRIASVLHAYLTADPNRVRGRVNLGILAILLVGIVGMHGYGTVVAWSTYQMDSQVFSNGEFSIVPDPSDTPAASVLPKPTEMPTSSATPTPKSPRITIMLLGMSANEYATDSINVLSIDPETKQVSIVNVIRDTITFPLYWGGTSPANVCNSSFRLTYFLKFSASRSGCFQTPDKPMRALENEVGYLVGVHIDYYALMYFDGFVNIVKNLPAGNGQPKGKLCVNNPTVISSPTYDWPDSNKFGFYLSAGYHCLDGRNALAYARDREGYTGGAGQITRGQRQQQVLVELFKRLKALGAGDMPKMEGLIGKAAKTDFPPEKVADMAAIGQGISPDNISSYVLGWPKYMVSAGRPCLMLDRVAPLSVQLYGEDSRYYNVTQPPNCSS